MHQGPLRTLGCLLLLAIGCVQDAPQPASPTSAPGSPVDPSPAPSPLPSPTPRPARFRGRLVEVARAEQPVALAARSGDSSLYLAQKTGEVVLLQEGRVRGRPVLDLSDEVSQGSEQGLLGLAFSPDGGLLYVNYTDLDGDTRIVEYRMRGSSVRRGSRREVLVVEQPYPNHNGGHLAYGPDGYLYVGLGDGGSGGDPHDNGQRLDSLLGKMLRIDPRPRGRKPYRVPPDNPFVGIRRARPEIWAYGLRNPWRYSFDRATGDLWIADVGQSEVEEINLEPPAAPGRNYGWDGFEGTLVYEQPVPGDAVPPVHEYGRELGATVIGGYVYRGDEIPVLQGAYLFGDFFAPELRALIPRGDGFRSVGLGVEVPQLTAFGEDAAGELYALSLAGGVFRLVP